MWWREVRGEPTRGRGRQGEEAGVVVGGVGGEGGGGGGVAGETSVGVRVPVLHRNLIVSSLHRALVVRRGVTRQEVAGAGAGAGAGAWARDGDILGLRGMSGDPRLDMAAGVLAHNSLISILTGASLSSFVDTILRSISAPAPQVTKNFCEI